jgi:hypothetical protein
MTAVITTTREAARPQPWRGWVAATVLRWRQAMAARAASHPKGAGGMFYGLLVDKGDQRRE